MHKLTSLNLIELIHRDFPFWDDLHAFWCELLNYNPITVTNSVAGAQHDVEALVNSINKKVVESLEVKDSSGESSDKENKCSGIEDAGLLAMSVPILYRGPSLIDMIGKYTDHP
ncbi:hypothetical protein M422DRAFT_245279 [Sphaerobolus stellatus SS14]|nr:hypothetical protein M422DRAFT_245279 [Sphaerobolus stellatus SS14]